LADLGDLPLPVERRPRLAQLAENGYVGLPCGIMDIDLAALPDALARLDDETTRRRVRHVVTENQRVLDTLSALRDGNVKGIGPFMTASHASMRDDYEITVPEVDTAVEAALAAEAYGARMTGGGFGGCILALVDAERAEPTATAVADAFATEDFAAPKPFVATPGEGARRVR
jgi:galactokinase